MTFSKELKDAISQLPSNEKDKLIFRLLKKDIALANRLLFELVDTQIVDVKREELRKRLDSSINQIVNNEYAPNDIHTEVRYMSGLISEYVFITKDKWGEIDLNLHICYTILLAFHKSLQLAKFGHVQKLYIGLVARIFKMLVAIKKLHEDHWMEFGAILEKLSEQILSNENFMKISTHHGLDIQWLLDVQNIPENIADIHKKLKENGYLK